MARDLIGHTLFHYSNCFEMYIYIITTFVVKAQLYDMKSWDYARHFGPLKWSFFQSIVRLQRRPPRT